MRQTDIEPNASAARIGGAPIRSFHDAAAATGANNKAVRGRWQACGPQGDEPRQFAGLLVVVAERAIGRQPRRTKKDNGVVHVLAMKTLKRFEVFREDAQRAGFIAIGKPPRSYRTLVGLAA